MYNDVLIWLDIQSGICVRKEAGRRKPGSGRSSVTWQESESQGRGGCQHRLPVEVEAEQCRNTCLMSNFHPFAPRGHPCGSTPLENEGRACLEKK